METQPDYCSQYHWKTKLPNSNNQSLPIYDYIIFSKELDLLEIRLYELNEYVTLFLIAESRLTLTGEEKPLYLNEHWSRFEKYHHKIRRVEVELIHNISDPWENEKRMRDEGLRLALSNMTNYPYLLITSDTDEIPKASFMHALTHCQLPVMLPPLVLQCDFYYYSFEYKHQDRNSLGSTINQIGVNESKQLSADALRKDRFNFQSIPQSCYHCTWCFNQLQEVRFKMAAYSHTEHNKIQFRTRDHILNHYRHGIDLFDRPDEQYFLIKNNQNLPQLLKSEPERFIYMINRSNLTNVGFLDA